MNAGATMKLRTDPRSPAYRKQVMIGSTAGLKPSEQFPEYVAWLAKREAAKNDRTT